MATFYPHSEKDKVTTIEGPFSLTKLQTLVGGMIRFVDLSTGDVMIINEHQLDHVPLNKTATNLANKVIRGNVLVCSGDEIE